MPISPDSAAVLCAWAAFIVDCREEKPTWIETPIGDVMTNTTSAHDDDLQEFGKRNKPSKGRRVGRSVKCRKRIKP